MKNKSYCFSQNHFINCFTNTNVLYYRQLFKKQKKNIYYRKIPGEHERFASSLPAKAACFSNQPV